MQFAAKQHPPGHDMPSQTHLPATQRWPLLQEGPSPHWHVPIDEQWSELPGAQVVHALPATPQLASPGVRHAPPSQQPVEQDIPSHMHAPATQRCPVAHGGPAPQAQVPAPVQVSAAAVSHDAHARPPAPQRASDGGTHVTPSQQPLGHEAALHTQRPPTQSWPALQGGPAPHTHEPAAEQPSARVVSHPTHTAPPLPQVATVARLQVAPEQQPPEQLTALQPLQRPPVHDWSAGQVSQAEPPAPHESGLSPATQAPCAQHPCGQDVPSQTQVLATQRWPRSQAGPLPHRQVPTAEQLSERVSHATQVAPPTPQVARPRVRQAVPLQHPLAHDATSQAHRPPEQR
jgi:hypothetical protein